LVNRVMDIVMGFDLAEDLLFVIAFELPSAVARGSEPVCVLAMPAPTTEEDASTCHQE